MTLLGQIAPMHTINSEMTIKELLQLVADNHHKKITLSEEEKISAIALLKKKGMEELDYGQEIKIDKVRLIKRVTGAVGVYFS